MGGHNHPARYHIIKISYMLSRFIAIDFYYAINSTILMLYDKSILWNTCLIYKVSTKQPSGTCAELFFL